MQIELKILDYAKEFYCGKIDTTTTRDPPIKGYSWVYGLVDGIPEYTTPGSAGMDLRIIEDVTLYPGECKLVGTGIAIYIKDPAVVGVLSPRSGLGHKGLILGNLIGWLDSDYQGEIKISLWNRLEFCCNDNAHIDNPCACVANNFNKIELKAGDRVAQLVFMPIIKPSFTVVEEFSNDTSRGVGGFGSSGK
jgi:dUTP pyrophosphatase